MDKFFINKLKESNSIPDIFEIIKDVVWKTINRSRAGLDLGLIEMGNAPEGFLGAYYVSGSNIIVMNETPLKRIQETNPNLLVPYMFSVLLHEYLHSLGIFDESKVRKLTYGISSEIFGEDSVVTQIAKDMRKFFPNFIYPEGAPQTNGHVKLVKDFDRSSIRYIG
jgi:hypothetical protein